MLLRNRGPKVLKTDIRVALISWAILSGALVLTDNWISHAFVFFLCPTSFIFAIVFSVRYRWSGAGGFVE